MVVKINENYLKLKSSYLFVEVARREAEFVEANPDADIIKMGIGDVTKPLVPTVINAFKDAVDEMGQADTFMGYGPEQGYGFLADAIIENSDVFYTKNSVPTLKEVRGRIVLLNRCGADINNTIYTDNNTGINLTGWPYQHSRKEACLQKVLIAKRNSISDEYFYLQDFFNLKPKKKWEIASSQRLDAYRKSLAYVGLDPEYEENP